MGSKEDKKESSSTKINAKSYGKVFLTLKNQLLPEEKLINTPSQNDGLSVDAETDLRIYGCELIQTAGILLRLPQVAMATGQVLLQRFYYSKSLVRHPVEHTAMACVCLASKIEEAPRRVRDVINVFTHIRQVNSGKPIQPVILDQNYIHLKNLIIKAERRVLKELGFCVHIKHPHKDKLKSLQNTGVSSSAHLLRTINRTGPEAFLTSRPFRIRVCSEHDFGHFGLKCRNVGVVFFPGNLPWNAKKIVQQIIVMYLQVLGFHNNQKLMQYSWNYMNDALRTDVFVRYQPETVACACIYLTSRKLRLPLPKNPHWYTIFGATEKSIRDICVKILKLYNRPKPNIEDLEKQVDALCEKYKEIRAKAKGVSGNNSPSNDQNPQKTSAHNAWGGFISRSGSHMPPPVNEKRSRSRSATRSPDRRHHKKSKKHRSRTRSPRNHKKGHKRKSYSRSRSNSPHKTRKTRDRKRSTSPGNDRDSRNDRYIDRHDDKYDKDRKYKDDRESKHRDKDKESRYDKYDEKKDRESKRYDRDDKYKDRDDKYKERDDKYKDREDKYKERDDKYKDKEDKYKDEKYSSKEHKKSKYRDEERSESRSKDRRRRS